jgi:hypothetical protein
VAIHPALALVYLALGWAGAARQGAARWERDEVAPARAGRGAA